MYIHTVCVLLPCTVRPGEDCTVRCTVCHPDDDGDGGDDDGGGDDDDDGDHDGVDDNGDGDHDGDHDDDSDGDDDDGDGDGDGCDVNTPTVHDVTPVFYSKDRRQRCNTIKKQ